MNDPKDLQPFCRDPEADSVLFSDYGAPLQCELIEVASPKIAHSTRTSFVQIARERKLLGKRDQRKQRVVQFVGVTYVGPRLFADLRDGRRIELARLPPAPKPATPGAC